MRIDPSILNRDQFIFRDCVIGGDECVLIFPSHLAVDWSVETLCFRSAILRKVDNLIVSAGLPKFTNLSEKPHLYPDPTGFNDWRVTTKEDGSCVIVSKHNLEPIVRTRGTVSVDQHSTGPEIHGLIAQHGILSDPLFSHGEFSAIFEHNTPNCPIVIRHEKPELVLLKIIRHEDYSFVSPDIVAHYAREWRVRQPATHPFTRLEDIVETCRTLKGQEGFVLEYNSGANLLKIKGLEYLKLHAFRSTVSMGNLLDLFFLYERPMIGTFLNRLEHEFDWESAQMARELVIKIGIAHTAVQSRIAQIKEHVDWKLIPIETVDQLATFMSKPLPRRDAALAIQAAFQPPWTAVAFKLLDNREIDDKMLRRLIEHELGI